MRSASSATLSQIPLKLTGSGVEPGGGLTAGIVFSSGLSGGRIPFTAERPSSATAERGALAAGEGGEGQDGCRRRDGKQQPA